MMDICELPGTYFPHPVSVAVQQCERFTLAPDLFVFGLSAHRTQKMIELSVACQNRPCGSCAETTAFQYLQLLLQEDCYTCTKSNLSHECYAVHFDLCNILYFCIDINWLKLTDFVCVCMYVHMYVCVYIHNLSYLMSYNIT